MLIQIVDDSTNMRETIKSVLTGLRAQFIEADNGRDAVQQFASQSPDLVIMDVCMDLMDGIEATQAIRSASPDAKVIIVSQYVDDDLRAAAQKAGAAEYVLKDDLSALVRIIEHGSSS
ncbi:MAG TPA: response regulator [Bacteroidota bacterium]|jgi:NarL family two-component system response regulator LiaR|nr:response regulator [Bacteroidota bacterium]